MAGITYMDTADNLTEQDIQGFFVGWPKPPSATTLIRLLISSDYRWIAVEEDSNRCIGYVTALSDGVLFGYISSLEVLPEYQHKGIGRELMQRMIGNLKNVYAIDLVCDQPVQSFYENCGLSRCSGMVIRHRDLL